MKERYAAKLLLAYRINGYVPKRQQCFESIFLVTANDWKAAMNEFVEIGKRQQLDYVSTSGDDVKLVFLGISDIITVPKVDKDNEVYYDVRYMMNPEKKCKIWKPGEKFRYPFE